MKKNQKGERLPAELLERMAEVLRMLAHPQRLRIIETLQRRGEAPVHEIVKAVDLPQGATSQHLNLMRKVGLLGAERRGREVWYHVADPRALTILDCIRKRQ